MDEDTVFKIIAEQFCHLNQTPFPRDALPFTEKCYPQF